MGALRTSYRETAPGPPHVTTDRYLASDFHRLTNPVSRRFTAPTDTPDSSIAHELHAESQHKAARAKSGLSQSDKRAPSIPFQSPNNSPLLSPAEVNFSAHGHDAIKIERKSSTSSGTRQSGPGPLDTCVKEDNSGIAQSFLESVNASIAPKNDQQPSSPSLDGISPIDVGSCECCCKCGKGSRWQPSERKLGRKSKSYTSLRTGISELSGWDLELPKRQEVRPAEKKEYAQGESPLEKLPAEVLDDIVAQLAIDLPPSGYAPRNVDLINCLLTSKTIHVATVNTLYRHITIPHSTIFSKFLRHVSEYPGLGTLIRRLDLSHFTSVGLGRSRQTNSEIENLTPKTLLKCLDLAPWIQEVLLQENLDDDIDANVLQKMFFSLPRLQAVDLCASSSPPFIKAFSSVMATLSEAPSTMISIKRLSLHECTTLPPSVYETLLPRLTQLTHLDVSHTRVTIKALESLPPSAQLTHLNLGRCTGISGAGVVNFLVTHPAVKGLVYLNLSCDIARYRLLFEKDVDRLLPVLPSTLRSLNLNGAHIHPHHVRLLTPLTKHLEELGLASANLSLADVNSLFREPPSSKAGKDHIDSPDVAEWVPSTLHYLDLTAIPAITQSTLFNTPAPQNILLTPQTVPLEVIELGDKAISSLRECRNTNKRLGWCVKELGRRGWYVREPHSPGQAIMPPGKVGPGALHTHKEGRRGWKMGAMWWGMRKVPVAWGEVGGLYGHYMFKK